MKWLVLILAITSVGCFEKADPLAPCAALVEAQKKSDREDERARMELRRRLEQDHGDMSKTQREFHMP